MAAGMMGTSLRLRYVESAKGADAEEASHQT